MRCSRCGGDLHRDRMYDLPRRVEEYFCLACGERFWMKFEAPPAFRDSAEQRAPESSARWEAQPILVTRN